MFVASLVVSRETVAAAAVAVVDGDGLVLAGEQIRLWGIDAPERRQRCERGGRPYACGAEAKAALAALVRRGPVACVPVDRDRYGRTVARCAVDGVDLGGELVRRGWALAYERYDRGYYRVQQQEAQAVSRGLWAGSFVEPWAWRHR